MWYENKKKFVEGVRLLSTKISDESFEESLTSAFSDNFTQIDADNLSVDESRLASKTVLYMVQRLKLFLLSPVKLQKDLASLGLSTEKSLVVTRLYSSAAREITNNMKMEDSSENETSIKWEIKTSQSEPKFRSKKTLAQLSFKVAQQEIIFEELDISVLKTLFDSFETIQKELDVLSLIRK